MSLIVGRVTAPLGWASYLIYGDGTGLATDDFRAAQEFEQAALPARVVDVIDIDGPDSGGRVEYVTHLETEIDRRSSRFLFELRFRLVGKTLRIRAAEGEWRAPNHTRIEISAVFDGEPLYLPGQTWCGVPSQYTLDGDETRELVVSCVAATPENMCQSREEFEAEHTPEQIAFSEEFGDELDMLKYGRFGVDA